MSEKILVSIIIPVYNAEKYIGRCLDSVLNQTFHNIEIIIVNDGSEDDSETVIQKYLKQDDRISYFYQENNGVSMARNKGMDYAGGKYILFVDSDDYVTNTYVADFVTALEKSGADFAVSGYYECYEKQQMQIPKNYFKESATFRDYQQEMLHNPIDNYFGVLWNKCFLLDKIRKLGLRFEQGRSFAEDYAFLIDYLKVVQEIVFINKCNYYYLFDRDDSLGKGSILRSRRVEDLSFVYKKYREFWEYLGLYQLKKKRIQFYAMKLYFEEMKLYMDTSKEERKYMEKELLRNNGFTTMDICLFKCLRKMKHILGK